MSDAPATPETEALDPREARAADRLADLRRLRKIGMALCEAMLARVHDAMRDHEPEDPGAVAREFERLSRSVYRIAALETRLDQDQAALAVRVRAERASAREAAARSRQEAIKYTTESADSAVVDLIEAEEAAGADKDRTTRLYDALSERLEDPREREDFADLPVSVLVERLCAALGVTPDWSLWEREDWAVEEWKTAAPGSPYATAASGATAGEVPSTTSPRPPSAAAVRRGDRQIVGDRMDHAESAVPLLTPSPTRWGGPGMTDAPPLGELPGSDGGGFERARFSAGSERGPP